MIIVLITSFVSFFIILTFIPVIIKVAHASQLFDLPSDRKVHKAKITSLGGVTFFLALILSISIISPFPETQWIPYFLAAMATTFFLGLNDDILQISYVKKFIVQSFAIVILLFQRDFQISSLYGFLGIKELHPVLSIVFSFLTMLVIINSFNLIDGVDGLAGVLGLITTSFFGCVFLFENEIAFAALSFSMSSSLIAFLIFNVTPAKIFMGDTGALLIGLVNAVLAVHFINLETSGNSALHFSAAPALAFAVLFIPLMDTLRVLFIRLYNRKPLFKPDKLHLHHVLLKRGYSHLKITSILATASVLLILFAIVAQPLGINFVILSLFTISFSVLGIAKWIAETTKKSIASQNSTEPFVQTFSAKIITPSGGIKDLEFNN